jgi:hypothetical protein
MQMVLEGRERDLGQSNGATTRFGLGRNDDPPLAGDLLSLPDHRQRPMVRINVVAFEADGASSDSCADKARL